MISATLKIFLLVLVLLITNACSHQSLPERQVKSIPPSEIPINWNARGRIAILHPSENWHASFVWQKNSGNYSLRFTGPLGQTQLFIEHLAKSERTDERNTLVMDNEKYVNNKSMEQLLAQYSPIFIPLSSLQYWLFGQANPNIPSSFKTDNAGNLRKLQQQGWEISFKNYQEIVAQFYPSKITAQKGEHKIKVFIKSREIQE